MQLETSRMVNLIICVIALYFKKKEKKKADKGGDKVNGREHSGAPVEGGPSKTISAALWVPFQGSGLLA